MENTVINNWEIARFTNDSFKIENEAIAVEFPLTIVVNGQEFATMVCTPTHLRELVIGFLASEGIIRFFDEIKSISIDETQGFAYVEISRSIDHLEQDHSKRFIGSCCGKSRQFYFKSDVQTAKTVTTPIKIHAKQCLTLMDELQSQSTSFQMTGGVHNAALCTVNDVLHIRTDIGRHNALDKIYGYVIENNVKLNDKLIVFSGRVSSEVLLKISKMGIGIVISNAAPTDLALKLANDLGITVVGFVRGENMNVYTKKERIIELNELKSAVK
ncbi:MAG TPA: formate dehydrogenase accessory sulfurtransferase FdhD [Bacillota bacterium]|nr:formate dehydrogenase accessory sulfurtransferase FdhD [Bacillota bacterium]